MANKAIIWDDSFLNDNPHGDTGLVRDTGYYINETRQALTERLDDEHEFDPDEPAPQPEQGRHKAGSAVAYVQDMEPTLRPDGVTVLNMDDAGRLWYDTLNGQIKAWNGSTAWVNLSAQGVGTILRWQSSAQYARGEIVEYQSILWVADADPPTIGTSPNTPEWYVFAEQMPDVIEFSPSVVYYAGDLTYYNNAWWVAVSPVLSEAPGVVPGNWTLYQVTTSGIADGAVTQPKLAKPAVGTPELIDDAVTFAKAGPDLYKVHIWDSTIPYLIDDIVRYGKQWWIALTNPPIGTIPSLAGTDWRRWTPQTVVSVSNTATVTNGYPDHVVFCDTTINPVYTLTLTDGTKVGDKITVACYGGGEITVVGTGLSEQKQLDNSIQYMWSAVGWLPLGGGSAGGGSGVSVGEVTWWPGQLGVGIPEGKLVADGTIYNIADYPTLFGKLGTLYGGDGATTFGVPNLQGIFPGAQGTQGTHGGAEAIGSLREDSIESHTHTQDVHIHTAYFNGNALPAHQHNWEFSSGTADSGSLGNAKPGTGSTQLVSASSAGTPTGAVVVDGNTAVNQATGGVETRPAALVGRWLIQAEPPVPSEINAVVVDVEIGDVRWQGHANQSVHDMICDGRSLITTNYPDLFAKIGYNFGGSGSNFNIPNLQGIFPGAYGTQGTHGGAEAIGTLREDAIESHTHPFVGAALPTHFHTGGFSTGDEPDLFCAFGYRSSYTPSSFSRHTGDGVYGAYTDTVSAGTPSGTVNAQAGAGAETRPAALVGHWVIRATQPSTYVLPDAGELMLTADRTVNFDPSMTALEIQALIDAQPKNLNDYLLVFQFANGTYNLTESLTFRNFYGGEVQILGNSSLDNNLSENKSVTLVVSDTKVVNVYRNTRAIFRYIKIDSSAHTTGIYSTRFSYNVNTIFSNCSLLGSTISHGVILYEDAMSALSANYFKSLNRAIAGTNAKVKTSGNNFVSCSEIYNEGGLFIVSDTVLPTTYNQEQNGVISVPAGVFNVDFPFASPPSSKAMQVGEVTWWIGAGAIPAGRLVCDGSTFSSATYPILASVLGGTTLPNLQGITPGAQGTQTVNGRTKGDGTAIGGIREDQLTEHGHVTSNYILLGNQTTGPSNGSGSGTQFGKQSTSGGDGAPENKNTIIKGAIKLDNAGTVERTGDYTRSTELVGRWLIVAG